MGQASDEAVSNESLQLLGYTRHQGLRHLQCFQNSMAAHHKMSSSSSSSRHLQDLLGRSWHKNGSSNQNTAAASTQLLPRRWLGRSVRYLWGFPGQPPVLAVEAFVILVWHQLVVVDPTSLSLSKDIGKDIVARQIYTKMMIIRLKDLGPNTEWNSAAS